MTATTVEAPAVPDWQTFLDTINGTPIVARATVGIHADTAEEAIAALTLMDDVKLPGHTSSYYADFLGTIAGVRVSLSVPRALIAERHRTVREVEAWTPTDDVAPVLARHGIEL